MARGKYKRTPQIRNQISKSLKGRFKGEKNPVWKGTNVGYHALHTWVRRNKPKPQYCEQCGINKPREVANISGKYKRDLNDFEWICTSCHSKKENRAQRLYSKNNPYTKEEIEYIIKNYKFKSPKEIAEKLGRTKLAIISKAYNLNKKGGNLK